MTCGTTQISIGTELYDVADVLYFSPLFLLLCWVGYIVAFIKVLTTYQIYPTWIHPLHHSRVHSVSPWCTFFPWVCYSHLPCIAFPNCIFSTIEIGHVKVFTPGQLVHPTNPPFFPLRTNVLLTHIPINNCLETKR
jgi:hypothetical protein